MIYRYWYFIVPMNLASEFEPMNNSEYPKNMRMRKNWCGAPHNLEKRITLTIIRNDSSACGTHIPSAQPPSCQVRPVLPVGTLQQWMPTKSKLHLASKRTIDSILTRKTHFFRMWTLWVSGWWLLLTPLKNMKVSWDDDIPSIWKNKKCSKPPTRFKVCLQIVITSEKAVALQSETSHAHPFSVVICVIDRCSRPQCCSCRPS